ncbi:MAG: hypothetical protein WDO68_32440 [Gammaproteobacteria bacterium]
MRDSLWKQPIFRAAQGVLNDMKVDVPGVLLNVAIHRANTEGFVTAFYFFEPATAGILSTERSWANSEWAKDRVTADPRRTKYLDDLKAWGKSWAPIVYAYRATANHGATEQAASASDH